jgi:hypothetical protein
MQPGLKKILRLLARGLQSGRPGSNRPPRPWQGRALPNELLPQILKELKALYFVKRAAKIGKNPF